MVVVVPLYVYVVAGTSAARRRHQPRSVVDASELSSACPLAADAGKAPGKAQQASPGLPALADHRADRQLSSRHSAEIAESQ